MLTQFYLHCRASNTRFSTFKGSTFGFQTVDFLPSQVDFCAFKKNLCTFKLQLSPFIPVTISLHWSGYLLLFLPESTFIPLGFDLYSARVGGQRDNPCFQLVPMKVNWRLLKAFRRAFKLQLPAV